MLRQRVLKSSVSESHFGTSATWSPHAHLQFPCCELPAAASMPRTPKYPPEDPNFDWVTSQAPRHSVAREFYGGVNIEPSATGCSADRLLNPLYTSKTASDAVNYAMEAIEKDGGAKPSSQQAAGDGADDQKEDWLQKEGKGSRICKQISCRFDWEGSSSRASSRSATVLSLLEDQCRLNGHSQT